MKIRNKYRLLTFFYAVALIQLAIADDLKDSPRVTPLVKVIQKVEPSVVALFTPAGQGRLINGSGTIIHEDGYVLTNNHVVPMQGGFALLQDAKPRRFRVIGRIPEKDLAVVRVENQGKLRAIPLGRSHDLLLGEPVIVAGNPGGRGIVFTSGIISSRQFLAGGPNALAVTNYDNKRYDTFIQFDAASNKGNSGGPLINMEGKLIGVVSALVEGEQNSNLAIPVDRVRSLFEEMMNTELKRGFKTGIQLKAFAERAVVESVEANSAAEEAKLQAGDVVTEVNGVTLRNRPDWQLTLHQQLQKDKALSLKLLRGKDTVEATLKPQKWPFMPAVEVDSAAAGVHYKFYHGKFSLLPDFSKIEMVREGTVDRIDLVKMRQDRTTNFALSADGYLKIPRDGIYRLAISSDDGSRLYIHGNLLIDNDGNHPRKQVGKLIRLTAGYHPIRIDYFEGNGDESLNFTIEGEEVKTQEVPADWLFH